jgi:hypothetical protein
LAHEVQGLFYRQQQLENGASSGIAVEGKVGSDSDACSSEVANAVEDAAMQWQHIPSWHVTSFILKTGDDLRQEELAMQLLRVCACAFAAAGCGVRMFVYDIVAVAAQAGSCWPQC